MGQKIQNIVIVGGGTAGWMSAANLSRFLKIESDKSCNITLIESSDISTIGVGESTIRTIRQTLDFLGLDEREFMVECDATFKTAIKFVNWTYLPNRNCYWHPFEPIPIVQRFPGDLGFSLSHYWLKKYWMGDLDPLDYACNSSIHLCDARKAPKLPKDLPYQGQIEYAYHLDAGLFANYLKRNAKEKGVKHIVDTVFKIELDDRGYISHLKTEHHGDLYGDLFIDCSGFRGLLINQALKEPFISFADSLLCDRAVAISIPRNSENKRDNEINNYTTAAALKAGWAWQIPLFSRRGNGYVYSSDFISPEEAETELRQHLNLESDRYPARHIQMRVGRTRRSWVKNCVSIGLSSGFIEPLESTGILFVEIGLINLFLNFPDRDFCPILIKRYNQIIQKYYEEVRDFITLHYCTTNREDTLFWKENKYGLSLSEALQDKLALWKIRLPNHDDSFTPERGIFPDYSYTCILAGMNWLPERELPILRSMNRLDIARAEQAFIEIKMRANQLKNRLLGHHEYLQILRDKHSCNNLSKSNFFW